MGVHEQGDTRRGERVDQGPAAGHRQRDQNHQGNKRLFSTETGSHDEEMRFPRSLCPWTCHTADEWVLFYISSLGLSHLTVHLPSQEPVEAGEGIPVRLELSYAPKPLQLVAITYRVDFGRERNVAMERQQDGTYTAVIPTDGASPGALVRWYFRAVDDSGQVRHTIRRLLLYFKAVDDSGQVRRTRCRLLLYFREVDDSGQVRRMTYQLV